MLPWLWAKCEERFRQESAVSRPGLWTRIFPVVHSTKALAALGYRVLYLLKQTEFWSPWLHLLGLQLARHFPEPPLPEAEGTPRARAQEFLGLCGQASLWGVVYILQFMQWWYHREHLLQPFHPRKAPPPPPEHFPYPESVALGRSARLALLPEDPTICTLCHRIRVNPAMSCSGYAFCYTCLVPHVQQFGHCPVSGQQMTVPEIRRIRDEV